MRALLDSNLFISYLLSVTPSASAVGAILEAAAEGRIALLFTPDIADEIVSKVVQRADLSARITAVELEALFADIAEIAEPTPRLSGPFPAICRDHKDDYLIAHALAVHADALVSWDKDLRDLRSLERLRFLSPPEFLATLRELGIL